MFPLTDVPLIKAPVVTPEPAFIIAPTIPEHLLSVLRIYVM